MVKFELTVLWECRPLQRHRKSCHTVSQGWEDTIVTVESLSHGTHPQSSGTTKSCTAGSCTAGCTQGSLCFLWRNCRYRALSSAGSPRAPGPRVLRNPLLLKRLIFLLPAYLGKVGESTVDSQLRKATGEKERLQSGDFKLPSV